MAAKQYQVILDKSQRDYLITSDIFWERIGTQTYPCPDPIESR